jgi:hypothetical protein
MSDAEKIPIALAGVAFITLPFVAGMIALYSPLVCPLESAIANNV